MSVCQYCNRIFAKSSLYSHQKRAKYCLKIQEQNRVIKSTPSFFCSGCEKTYVTKRDFNAHQNRCYDLVKKCLEIKDKEIFKLNAIIDNHEKEISELKLQHEREISEIYKTMNERKEACIEEIAKQPKTQNISNKLTCLTPLDLDKEKIDKVFEDNFTVHHFFKGQKGVAECTADYLLTDKDGNLQYICTDSGRYIFGYKRIDGDIEKIEKDLHAKKLTRKIMASVIPLSTKIMTERNKSAQNVDMCMLIGDNYRDITNMESDNTGFKIELASRTV